MDVAGLRKLGYFRETGVIRGRISWGRGLSVTVFSDIENNLILINPLSLGQISVIFLKSLPSNLGKGRVWYFLCPDTGKRCRKLYWINSQFSSRHAFPDAMYRSQAESRRDRILRRYITLAGTTKNPKAEWDNSDQQHFRAYYRGKPTRRYRDYLRRRDLIAGILQSGEIKRAFELPKRFLAKVQLLRDRGR